MDNETHVNSSEETPVEDDRQDNVLDYFDDENPSEEIIETPSDEEGYFSDDEQ